jgi:hypothetical protein
VVGRSGAILIVWAATRGNEDSAARRGAEQHHAAATPTVIAEPTGESRSRTAGERDPEQFTGEVVRYAGQAGVSARLLMAILYNEADKPRDPGCMSMLKVLEIVDQACCAPLSDAAMSEAESVDLARVFKALSDPVRLRLLNLIASGEGGEACVCDRCVVLVACGLSVRLL